ncbi:MAG: ABC transporter permease [Amphiplicatus sp.]
MTAVRSIVSPSPALKQQARVLLATAWIELRKRYAGTFLGPIWLLLYPALFLSMYMFLYMVVFKVRFPELSEFSYVVFVFCGLVPYIAMMETSAFAASVIRQNMHLIRNVMLPIELLPARVALTACIAQIPGLLILLTLSAIDSSLSAKALLLPLVMIIELIFFLGLAFWLAALGGLLPDLQAAINIILIFLLFISPIAFPPEMVPDSARLVVQLNPVSYLIGLFRAVVLAHQTLSWSVLAAAGAVSVLTFVSGFAFFRRFKSYIVDHE